MRSSRRVTPDARRHLGPDHLMTEPLDFRRLGSAKSAYTTRFVSRLIDADPRGYGLVSGEGVVPRAGDVVLARVHKLGQHVRIERPNSYKAGLFEGDEILVAYGDRYAPDQFEAEVPAGLGMTNLVAAGGVAGTVLSAHALMKAPTQIEPLGLLVDARGTVTLGRCAPFKVVAAQGAKTLRRVGKPLVIGVLGTSMNSGKTTTVGSIV